MLSVPEDATAYLRNNHLVTLCTFKWARKSPSIEDAARRAARELTNIVADAEAQILGENNSGYGNLSQYHLVFMHDSETFTDVISRLRRVNSEKCQWGTSYR